MSASGIQLWLINVWKISIDNEVTSNNCTVLFYNHGIPSKCPRKSDRQTPVLKWLIKEIYCSNDEPLEVNQNQFEVLLRSFKNFLLFLSSSKIKSSRQIGKYVRFLNL